MNVSVGDEWEGTSERKLVAREKRVERIMERKVASILE
jgi:hypothetical protein